MRLFPGRAGEMMRAAGATVVLSAARTREAIKRDGPDKTISEDALNELLGATGEWVMTRILRKGDATGSWAKQVELEVTVRLDGEDGEPGPSVRFNLGAVPDGEHRRRAAE